MSNLALISLALVLHFCACAEECGISAIRHNPAIVKGSDTVPGEWPWHVALLHRKGRSSLEYACGGTLISREFVLTAAHCAFDADTEQELPPRKIFVRLGAYNLDEFDGIQQNAVDAVHLHQDFSKSNLKNDIALLRLAKLVQLNDRVATACLNDHIELTNQRGTSIGWGYTEHDELSKVLKKAVLPVQDMDDCRQRDHELFVGKPLRGLLCVGDRRGTSVCNGDSGGGLFFQRGKVWFLGGIVSFTSSRGGGSNLCFVEGYAAYTNVAVYKEWIELLTGVDPVRRPTISTQNGGSPTISTQNDGSTQNGDNLAGAWRRLKESFGVANSTAN